MKSICALIIGWALTIGVYGQGVFTNDVNSALQKVIQDYPNKFANLKGDQISANVRNVQYRSTVDVPGSLHCVLTPYRSSKKEKYSWKCLMLESENYTDAKARYTELYNQIRNTIVKIEGEKPFILNGNYEAPADDKKYTTVLFQLLPATGEMQKLKVELTLLHTINDWKLFLSVYDEERRSDEQVDLTELY